MPCRDYESDYMVSNPRHDFSQPLKQRADLLARVACRALSALEKFDPELKSVKDTELRKFWAEHKKHEAKRIADEEKEKARKLETTKLRKAALSKLTPEEIKAFGIKV